MRATAALFGVLLVAATALPAAGLHNELRQQEDYVIGGDVLIACDALNTSINVGGVCFELDGREETIGIHVLDLVHDRAGRLESKVERMTADEIDDAFSTRYTSGLVQFRTDTGNTIQSTAFCNEAPRLQVPDGATRVRVILDGALFGNVASQEFFGACGPAILDGGNSTLTPFTGATKGTVFMTVPEDP